MQGIGSLLVLLGAGSFLLGYLNVEFLVISWIDKWGTGVGNGIRAGMIVVGVVLWLLGRNKETPPASS
jgi:hypothetical protein